MKTKVIGTLTTFLGIIAFFVPVIYYGKFDYLNDVISVLNSKSFPVRDLYNYLFLAFDISLLAFILTKFRGKTLRLPRIFLIISTAMHPVMNFYLPITSAHNIRLPQDYFHDSIVTVIVILIILALVAIYLNKNLSRSYRRFTLAMALIIIVSGIISLISLVYYTNLTGLFQKIYLFGYLLFIFTSALVEFNSTKLK